MSVQLPLKCAPGWEQGDVSVDFRIGIESERGLLVADGASGVVRQLAGAVEFRGGIVGSGGYLWRYAGSAPHRSPVSNAVERWSVGGDGCVAQFVMDARTWIPAILGTDQADGKVVAMAATTFPPRAGTAIRVEHQLVRFDPEGGRRELIQLPNECIRPIGYDGLEGETIFEGAGRIQAVDRRGHRRWWLRLRAGETVHRVSWHPRNGTVAVGGAPLRIHDPGSGEGRAIHAMGLAPAWDSEGEWLYFRKNSADLWRWSAKTGAVEMLLESRINRFPESRYAAAPIFDRSGRHLVVNLTRREPRRAGGESQQSAWFEQQTVAIVDRWERRWRQIPVGARSLVLLEPEPG